MLFRFTYFVSDQPEKFGQLTIFLVASTENLRLTSQDKESVQLIKCNHDSPARAEVDLCSAVETCEELLSTTRFDRNFQIFEASNTILKLNNVKFYDFSSKVFLR